MNKDDVARPEVFSRAIVHLQKELQKALDDATTLSAENERLRAALQPRPLETAPKDSSYFLMLGRNFDGGAAVVCWDDDLEWWTLDDGKNPEIMLRHETELTGWLPLPQALAGEPR